MPKHNLPISWKVFKASSKHFEEYTRLQLMAEGYEEWYGSINSDRVPPGIWEQYLLENLSNRTEIRLLGFKRDLDNGGRR